MTRLPSESWYGSSQATLETQLRYTPLHGDGDRRLLERLASSLRSATNTLASRDIRVGRWWLRAGLALLIWGAIWEARFALAAGVCLLTLAGMAWLWDRLSLSGLRYERQFRILPPDTPDGKDAPRQALTAAQNPRAFLDERLELTLTLSNQKLLPLLSIEIEDGFPAALDIEGLPIEHIRVSNRKAFRSFWSAGAYQRLARSFIIPCTKRGYHSFGPLSLRTGDGIGLFNRTVEMPDTQSLIIYPRLYSATELKLPAKNPFGTRGSKQRMFEDPLRTAGIREWQPSDSIRRIHWKATARNQELQSRLYEPSEEPQLLIFLNAATMERFWEGQIPDMAERAISVAGSIAALATEQRMPVGLIVNAYWPGSDQLFRLLPGRSPQQLMHILEMLAAVDMPNSDMEGRLLHEAPRLPWGATIAIVTAVTYDALLDAIVRLTHAGRKVALFTLADEAPGQHIPGLQVHHLAHLGSQVASPKEVL